MNIWYVSKYVAPPRSGTASGRGYLLMKELALMGHRVSIVTSDSNQLAIPPHLKSNYLFEELEGIQLCWVRTAKYSIAKSIKRILSWLHFEWRLLSLPLGQLPKPDVIIVSSLSLLTILNGFLWRIRYKCQLVFEIRDIWPLTITEEGGFKSLNPFVLSLGLIERLGYKYADTIVGTMPNLGEHVKGVLGYPKNTYCIPMGVDQSMLDAPEQLPNEYIEENFPPEKFIVAHVGSIGISNALDTFLDCAESLKNNTNIHFLVVGGGDLLKMYQSKYAHLPNLTFGPKVPKAMVQSVLHKCDLLYFSVHSSKVWMYGQSLNKVIDYMLSGKPIVASYTGYPSMINEANCGSCVPTENVFALQKEILSYSNMSAHLRSEMGERGRTWLLQNRLYSQLAKEYLSILRDKIDTKNN